MIVVAVIGILAALALPSFMDSVRKGRRSDAFAALSAVQQAQERWRSNHTAYTTRLTEAPDASPAGLGLSTASAKGLYTITIEQSSSTLYTAAASAVSGTTQASDTNCTTMRLRLRGGNVEYGGCAACSVPSESTSLTDPNRCWSR